MATHSDTTHTDSNSQNSEDSTIAAYVDEIVWDFINDPVEAEIEAQILAQAEAQQNEAAAQSRRHIQRNREAGHFRLMADYFDDNPINLHGQAIPPKVSYEEACISSHFTNT